MKKLEQIKDWIEVDSGIIEQLFYDENEEILYVMFKRTFDVWGYENVSSKENEILMESISIGKYFLAFIKKLKISFKITE